MQLTSQTHLSKVGNLPGVAIKILSFKVQPNHRYIINAKGEAFTDVRFLTVQCFLERVDATGAYVRELDQVSPTVMTPSYGTLVVPFTLATQLYATEGGSVQLQCSGGDHENVRSMVMTEVATADS